jgi:hypothetical protein
VTCSRSEASSAASAGSILDSSAPVCELCGLPSRTTTAAESLPGIGPESPAIPTCAPLGPTPVAHDDGKTFEAHMAMKARMPGGARKTPTSLTVVTKAAERGQFCPCRCHTSTSSVADSRVRISPTPARAQASTGSARVFGASTPASFASFDPDTSSWRTSQLCLDGDLDEFSETWPRAGMTRNGTAYRLRPLAPLIGETGSGSSRIPTPTAGDAKSSGSRNLPGSNTAGMSLTDYVRPDRAKTKQQWPTPHGMPKPGQHRRPGPSGNELGRAVNQAEAA